MTGRGPTKPGARTSRPGSSRPARTRAAASQRVRAVVDRATDATRARGAATTPAVAGWRARIDRARADARTRRFLALGGALVFLAIIVGPTLKAYVAQRQQISALREQVGEQEKRVKDLQELQAKWEDPAFVEQQARQRLKFVKPGEKAYTILDPQDSPATAPGMATASRDTAWYLTVWSSLQAADAPAAAR